MSEKLLADITAWMEKGLRGRALAGQYTAAVDALLSDIVASSRDNAEFALLATGGYGRKELAPFSDIDIMFFSESRQKSSIAEKVLYRLWDEKLDISHAYRTDQECIEEASRDIRTRTSLLEARYIAGSKKLYEKFRKEVYPVIAYRKQKQFVAAKLDELAKRHTSTGDSIFLLEPHIKEGDGGLRDIHAVLWLCRVAFRVEDLSGLSGLLTPQGYKRLLDSYDFMIQVRYCLHRESRRKNDVLSFEYQRPVALCMGFRDTKKFSGPERMMRYYYLKSRIIRDISHEVIVRCSRQYMPFFRDFTTKWITDDISLSGGRLITHSDDLFRRKPEKIMEAFYCFSKTGKGFSSRLREQMRENLIRLNRRTRSLAPAVNHFLEIMKGGRVYETIREMHEAGVLGRFIPEFGALRSLVIHEAYHMFTVDEHTLLSIRNLERLKTTTVKSLEGLKDIILGMRQVEVLFLALLFHDIGKAAGRHHEEEGYRRLKSIMERLHIAADKRLRIEFLVRNHILMSRMAMTRETDDPEVVARFADAVGDIENLKAIYLITYADMSAVNPTFWSVWKASLVRGLYEKTLRHLAGFGAERKSVDAARLFPAADGLMQEFREFLDAMPERYYISTVDMTLKEDFLLSRRAAAEGAAVRIDVLPDGIAEIVVSTSDAPGLFSRIVGYLSAKRLNIVHGQLFTGKGGIVIDKISVSNWKEIWWNGCEQELAAGLRDIVLKKTKLEPVRQTVPDYNLYDLFIEIDNESLESRTLIEVFSQDRIGLLYDISRVLYDLDVSITSARINTEAGVAQDVFSVQEDGGKVSAGTTYKLLKELWKILRD